MNNRRLMAYLLLTVAYVVSGKLGLMLALAPGYASPIFPPAGIAVAAAFIGGRRILSWVFLGSLLLNVWVDYAAHHQINATGFAAASAIAAASMLQAALGGWWLRRVVGYPASFDRGRDILYFLLSAPVICLASASLSVSALTVLGIVGAASFAVNWAAWWVGDTLGVVVMLPLVMIAIGEPRALWQSRVRTVAVPMLLIFAFFVAIFLKTNQWEYNDSLTEFRQLSQQTANRVQAQLEGQESLLEQTAELFIHDANGHVTREEFHRFVEKSLVRFPAIQALEWAPHVDAAHRASFEAAQRNDFPGFEIRERNAAGQLQRAGGRTQFYPVTYVEPFAGNEAALGFDLASTPDRHAALTDAVKRGVAVATPSVRLVQEHQEQAGMLLLLAVNNGSNESGVALTVLRMGDFMDKLLLDMRPMLYTRLIDLDEQKALYDNFAPGSQNALHEHTFNFGTRHYRLQTAPTPAYFMQHHGWQSWSVLVAGLLGTGLFGALLLLGTGYTARIEAEVKNRTRELKESESRFRNILDHAPIGMGIAALDGRFTQINQAFCAIVGYGKDELKKMTIREITHPEDLSLDLANKQRLIGGEISSYQMDKRYIRKDGQTVWVQVTASIERDASGMPLYLIGQVEDITERRQAKIALHDSEERLSMALAGADMATWDWHIPSGALIFSARWAEIQGYTLEELPPRVESWETRVFPDDMPHVREALDRHFKGEAPVYESEHRVRHKDGHWVWVLGRGKVVERDEAGSPVRAVGTALDITERKHAEEALRESESRYRLLVETSPFCVHEIDLEGRLLSMNRAGLNMLGLDDAGKICGTPYLGMVSQQDAGRIGALLQDAITNGTPSHFEFAATGDVPLYFKSCFIPLKDASGKVLKLMGITEDITERKEYEEELKRSNAELEQFSYVVSHDMRQPLRMISSYLQLIEMSLSDQLDREKRSYFSFAIEGAKRIDQMLVALLEYSRVGRMGEPPMWIESRVVLDEALKFIQPALAEAQAKLSITGDWPRILVSHDEILRLFQNLIGNAAKYRIAGRIPEITVTSKMGKNEWCLCVADNGVGIIPDQIKRLFQVFQRLQSRAAYEGTGIWLALCRKIAEHHKGRIWAESAGEGQGSKFCVVLPMLREETLPARGETI